MSNNVYSAGSPWSAFSGPNLGYVLEQYDLYLQSPEEVDAELVALFQAYGAPQVEGVDAAVATTGAAQGDYKKVLAAVKLAEAIRTKGHLAADLYPLKDHKLHTALIDESAFGLSAADLAEIPATVFFKEVPAGVKNGKEAIDYLKSVYTDKIAFEYSQVSNEEEFAWIQSQIESGAIKATLSNEEKKALLERLTRVENFEKFIHKTFVGQKRFSGEGLDTQIVLLDEILKVVEKENLENVRIGMAHRGRLNVLTHILNKPYDMMFSDFAHVSNDLFFPEDGRLEITKGWTGDVKYHMGASYTRESGMNVKLAYNPSHLEVVAPVVLGTTRAAQDDTTKAGAVEFNPNKALGILIHGDAAFPGQGIVTETLNFAKTEGFTTGGTIHIIANNMIGFTTELYDSRSSVYSSDPAKGYEVPVIHVNADEPEAVAQVGRFAAAYRQKFGKDILIDLIGYRRYGHNETDDPTVTNPETYKLVSKHDPIRVLYGTKLAEAGLVSMEDVKALDEKVYAEMQAAYDHVKEMAEKDEHKHLEMPEEVKVSFPEIETAVEIERLEKINEELLQFADGFQPQNKLAKILEKRREAFASEKIDWGHAETLAFATIIQDGHPVRFTGQDAQRGTFSQRHLVLHDKNNGSLFTPLHHISGANASFTVHNSPLTEAGVVGFEYGYNLENPNVLSIWEAQFGDFANMAQVMFDNFISAARSKWGQKSGLVMLLPHGYEGQGPEHSSSRMERFLQLSAENNWFVANCSNAGNYYHLLRRQAGMLGTEGMRPLVVVSPKSLLRHPLAAASSEQLAEGKFQEVIEQPTTGNTPKAVEKILLASGKVTIDLADRVKDGEGFDHLHIVRVEQLYPFPAEQVKEIISRFPNAKEIVWVQEEPKNQGAWNYMLEHLYELSEGKKVRYVGRPAMSSTSEGDGDAHKAAQAALVAEAVGK
ncbi:2-oxoglutarate dehydrogenase E1 component [Lysinibacillus odysseyi]|uniref:2-oxoglutarate dehydrogenase E1 component n=1 Tax=Lysinibacillus odysseyi 34hs-1 = NBRC 100172 TaxID=1220589 RepID=A0A0A3J470_9BACI|nr:2-oxoglutarate dehydrogenase E1 component [Lysinibacillus odysseyi]KGR81827.1 2-oxoglutarate dehydrogenase [Lysinibacillus odysseyi 34hs-1 = NBRC 100172]